MSEMNAILLHGMPGKKEYYSSEQPSASNAHWFAWLQNQLMTHDIKADTPEVPDAYAPQWRKWVKEVERFEILPTSTLVGHSCGGGFWLRYLSEHRELCPQKVILVAPWLDPTGELEEKTFFDFVLDRDLVSRVKNGVSVYVAPDDYETIQRSVQKIEQEVAGVDIKKFPAGHGHFTLKDMKTTEFPELVDEIVNQ